MEVQKNGRIKFHWINRVSFLVIKLSILIFTIGQKFMLCTVMEALIKAH
jgi:hypothetical protein